MSNTQIQKYKYKIHKTQIQHKMKCQKYPTFDIFLQRGLFKDIENHISKYRYTNTHIQHYYEKVPKTPHVSDDSANNVFKIQESLGKIPKCKKHL